MAGVQGSKRNFDFDDLGRYFSALSNEANLKKQECGWLILGVKDKPRIVVGTTIGPNWPSLDSLKREIANHTTSRITCDEIHELRLPEGRVLMFEIPSALRGMPTAWKGHYFGREGESLGALSLNEIEQIRGQVTREDWSAKVCIGATVDDLDPAAVRFACEQYREKNPKQAGEIDAWDDLTFLNKAKVCISGQTHRTAIFCSARTNPSIFSSPGIARITWVLQRRGTASRRTTSTSARR